MGSIRTAGSWLIQNQSVDISDFSLQQKNEDTESSYLPQSSGQRSKFAQKNKNFGRGNTETRRKTKDKWCPFGPPDLCAFIRGRVSIFRTCVPSRKDEGTEKHRQGDLDFRVKIVAS